MSNMELFLAMMSILSPISVGLFVQAGVKAQIKANENNITKLVHEELEKELVLLDEKISKNRADRWWNLKFELFLDLNDIMKELSVFEEEEGGVIPNTKALHRIIDLEVRQHAIFKDELLLKRFIVLNESTAMRAVDINTDFVSDEDWTELAQGVQDCLSLMEQHLGRI